MFTTTPVNSGVCVICIALEGAEGIGGAMALEVVPAAAGRLHSDQYTCTKSYIYGDENR